MKGAIWRTPSGYLVMEVERKTANAGRRGFELKIDARRATGGRHGWLWLRNLQPATKVECARFEAAAQRRAR